MCQQQVSMLQQLILKKWLANPKALMLYVVDDTVMLYTQND
jgi:hypothetical protein